MHCCGQFTVDTATTTDWKLKGGFRGAGVKPYLKQMRMIR